MLSKLNLKCVYFRRLPIDLLHIKIITSYYYLVTTIRRHQIFLEGPRTKMKKSSENFWHAYGAQKRGSQIFRLRRAIFVVDVLKTVKPDKKQLNFSQNSQNEKKVPNIFACGNLFFQKVLDQSEGGVPKHTSHPT